MPAAQGTFTSETPVRTRTYLQTLPADCRALCLCAPRQPPLLYLTFKLCHILTSWCTVWVQPKVSVCRICTVYLHTRTYLPDTIHPQRHAGVSRFLPRGWVGGWVDVFVWQRQTPRCSISSAQVHTLRRSERPQRSSRVMDLMQAFLAKQTVLFNCTCFMRQNNFAHFFSKNKQDGKQGHLL